MVSLRPLPHLWRITVAVVVLHVTAIAAERVFGVPRLTGALRQVDLNAEGNATAWFGSFLLLAAAAVAAAMTVVTRSDDGPLARRWAALSALLVVMSVDETAQLHDLATGPLRRLLGTELGLFHFAWVLPGLLVVAAAVLHLAPLARSLDPAERTRLVRAAAVYVLGAVVMEMAGGLVVDADVVANGYPLSYLGVVTVEETLELVGAMLLLGVLLDVASRRGSLLLVAVRTDPVGAHVDIGSGRTPCP